MTKCCNNCGHSLKDCHHKGVIQEVLELRPKPYGSSYAGSIEKTLYYGFGCYVSYDLINYGVPDSNISYYKRAKDIRGTEYYMKVNV